MEKVKQFYNSIPKGMKETIKEFLRLCLIGIVSYLLSGRNIDQTILYSIILKTLDKMLHEFGKEHDIEILKKGVTRFWLEL